MYAVLLCVNASTIDRNHRLKVHCINYLHSTWIEILDSANERLSRPGQTLCWNYLSSISELHIDSMIYSAKYVIKRICNLFTFCIIIWPTHVHSIHYELLLNRSLCWKYVSEVTGILVMLFLWTLDANASSRRRRCKVKARVSLTPVSVDTLRSLIFSV